MTRLAILVATGTFTAALATACGDTIDNVPPATPGAGGAGNGGSPSDGGSTSGGSSGQGGVDTSNANKCTDECCPTDPSCYSGTSPTSDPRLSFGAECLATRDNTDKPHIQMRQTWLRPVTPKGNTIPVVYGTLNGFTNMKDPTCKTPNATSGYMQLIDFDLSDPDITKNVSTVGYATYVTDTAAAKKDGLVIATVSQWKDVATYNGASTDFSLPKEQMSPTTGYPPGLPAPMPQPWDVGPTKAKRLADDFTLPADREKLLKMFDTTDPTSIALPANGGYSGVFFFDGAKGTSHGFSPMSWQVIYDPLPAGATKPNSMILVPIREAETRSTFNDPKHPDCVGRFRADGLTAPACVLDYSAQTNAPFIGWPGVNDTPGEGSSNVHGYFLITELEQIFSGVLGSTLCVSYPTAADSETAGWSTSADKRCRAPTNAKTWNPSDPINGLPMGDWCAATNAKSDANCHDAYASVSYHSFAGANIKLDASGVPVTAPAL